MDSYVLRELLRATLMLLVVLPSQRRAEQQRHRMSGSNSERVQMLQPEATSLVPGQHQLVELMLGEINLWLVPVLDVSLPMIIVGAENMGTVRSKTSGPSSPHHSSKPQLLCCMWIS